MRMVLIWVVVITAAYFIFVEIVRLRYEVPILMYHRVDYPDRESPGLYVTPQTFEKQMQFLKAHNYRVLPLKEVVRMIKNKERVPLNTVVITFDDGYLDNFTNAFPVLKKLEFPATIFMISNNIGKDGWLAEEDLRILDEAGIAIESHTANHAFLPEISDDEQVEELVRSKQRLEEVLGRPVTLFSYPAGGCTLDLAAKVESAGYEGAVTTNYSKKRHDPYRLHRVKVGESRGNLFNFWAKTTGLYQLGKRRVEAKGYEAD